MKSPHELNVVDIRRFELYTRVGISHVALEGGYDAVREYYEKKTGRSFDKDMELAKNPLNYCTANGMSAVNVGNEGQTQCLHYGVYKS